MYMENTDWLYILEYRGLVHKIQARRQYSSSTKCKETWVPDSTWVFLPGSYSAW